VYGQVQLATSQDFYFDSDSIRLRATFRFGAKIADVERVVKLAVTDLGS
jgi:HK97 family phage major capsid protein